MAENAAPVWQPAAAQAQSGPASSAMSDPKIVLPALLMAENAAPVWQPAATVAQSGPAWSAMSDPKIMLPAPQPTFEYLSKLTARPEVMIPPDSKLVILDLNGTLLARNRRTSPAEVILRPSVRLFLRYLLKNFAVMIWSSATPANVHKLVRFSLGLKESQLVAIWGRNMFGLSNEHYSQNVQCYKDLTRVWASDAIQRNMPGYDVGKRFDQRNTILIDDSVVKAAAQPYNMVEISEFKGASNGRDELGEVAGYLELLKMQVDVSQFIYQIPFKANGTWSVDWPQLCPAES